jgi:hypothetical protein
MFAEKNDLVTLKGLDKAKHDGVVVSTHVDDDGDFMVMVAYLDNGRLVRREVPNNSLIAIHDTNCAPSASAKKALLVA